MAGDDSKKIIVSQDDLHYPPMDNPELIMPEFIMLKNGKIMRRRSFPAVIRMHKFKEEINPHEYFYSELLLYRPWVDESHLYPKSVEKCKELHCEYDAKVRLSVDAICKIEQVKRGLFPHRVDVEEGREMVEKFEFDKNEEIGMDVDPDGEQRMDDDQEVSIEDAVEYLGFHPDELEDDTDLAEVQIPDRSYQVNNVMDMETLLEATRQLVPEQRVVLNMAL